MTKKLDTWTKKASKEVADCRIFKVREDSSVNSATSKEHSFFVIENPDWVNVLAITKESQVIVIEQFRHGTEEVTLEIPGGMVDHGEDAGEAAMRELIEETGYTPRKVISLGRCRPNPAIQNNWLYHYLAIDCEKTHEVSFDETEDVSTKLVDFAEFSEMISSERITHSAVLVAFLKYQLYKSI